MLKIKENKTWKVARSKGYNFIFNKETGFFVRWGETKEQDPVCAGSPEIIDMEISTVCHGVGKPCSFCYKSNTPVGENMSFETFKTIFDKLPKTIGQIAFGIGDIGANLEMYKIFEYSKENGVVPNVTINGAGLTDYHAEQLKKYCGAVAVSNYGDNLCFNAVKKLTDLGMKQINIHQLLAKQTLSQCTDLLSKVKMDARLEKLNAVVFLSLKKKGGRNNLTTISQEEFNTFAQELLKSDIRFGFDSCSSNKFLLAIKDNENYKDILTSVEPCESTLFSGYISVAGKFFPCSFCEGETGWEKGIDIKIADDFVKEVWGHADTEKFRLKLLSSKCKMGQRHCHMFDI